MSRLVSLCLAAIIVSAPITVYAGNETIYASGIIGNQSAIFTVDGKTGEANFVSPFFGGNAGIDFSPNGLLYGAWGSTLGTFNPRTNKSTEVTTELVDFMTGVSFTPDGRLYAINAGAIGEAQSLYELDPATGATLSGIFLSGGHGFISGIEFAGYGKLYALGDYLQTVDLITGKITTLTPFMSGPQLRDPDIDATGIVRASAHEYPNSWSDLYALNLETGERTMIGPATNHPPPIYLFGVATAVAAPVPLPMSLPMLALGLLVVVNARRAGDV